MKKNPSPLLNRATLICSAPLAVLFAANASAASVSWTGATDAVWSTGGDWVERFAQIDTGKVVFDGSSVANYNTTIGSGTTVEDLKITTPEGLISIGGMNTLTLGAGGFSVSNDTLGLAMEAVVAIAVEQARSEASMQKLAVKGGADVSLSKIGMGDLTLGGANSFAAAAVVEDRSLSVPGRMSGVKVEKLAFTNFGTTQIGAAPRVAGSRVGELRFGSGVERGGVRTASNRGKGVVKITVRGGVKAGANTKPATSDGASEDLRAALALPDGVGPLLAQNGGEGLTLGDTGSINTDASNVTLGDASIVPVIHQNVGRQYTTSKLAPLVSPPSASFIDAIGIKLGTSVIDGYGYGGQEGAGGGPGPGTTGFLSGAYVGGSPSYSQKNWINYDIATMSFNPLNSNPKVTDTGVSAAGLTFSANGGAFFETPGFPTVGRELDWTVWCNNGGNQTFSISGIPFEAWELWVYDYSMYNWNQWTKVTSSSLGAAFGTGSSTGVFGGSYQQAMAAVQILQIPVTVYWKGNTNNVWSASPSNFTTDLAGLAQKVGALTSINNVVFNATGATNFANTTLGSDQSIKTLRFGSNAITSVGIGGANTLTITPASSATGVTVDSLSGNHTISTKVALGAAQTWTVTDANQILTASGVISGGFALTKAGAGTLVLSAANTYAGATTISAGTLQLGNGGATGSVSTANNLTNNGTLAVNRSSTATQGTDFGLIVGTGGFTQAGSGTTIFNLANTYTGPTSVNEGTLQLSGSITSNTTVNNAALTVLGTITGTATANSGGTITVSGTISGSTTVNSGGTLAGNNSIGAIGSVTVNSGGTLSPGAPEGNDIGELFTGTVTFNPGSIYSFQIDTTNSAVDRIIITGDLNIAAGAVMNAIDLQTVVLSGSVPIMTYTGSWNGGGFLGLADEAIFTVGLNAYQISYNGADGLTKEVTLTVVPEPGAAVSLLGGLGLLFGVRRRRA